MSDIFISYAREDAPTAETLARVLEAEGWTVFWDRTIPPGKTFDEVIDAELSTAGCAIVLWSEAAVSSRWVRAEAGAALDRGVLIPVLIEDVLPPLAFRQIHAAFLIDWEGEQSAPELELVIDVVRSVISGGPTATPGTSPKNGTPGPKFIDWETVPERGLGEAPQARLDHPSAPKTRAKLKMQYKYCPVCNQEISYWRYLISASPTKISCSNCGSKLQHTHISVFEKFILFVFVGLGIVLTIFGLVIFAQEGIPHFWIISGFYMLILDYWWYRYLMKKKPLQKIG
jgi:uncharacterized protein (DUF983 family)